jgi:hypothetical protein
VNQAERWLYLSKSGTELTEQLLAFISGRGEGSAIA